VNIGLDFDNTIVSYADAFRRICEDKASIPKEVKRSRSGVKDYLLSSNQEDKWTLLQGELYGPGMRYATPFDGCIEAIKALEERNKVYIVSHRSKKPYGGQDYELHNYAREWIKNHLSGSRLANEMKEYVSFHEALEQKVEAIRMLKLDIFVDDLEKVLLHPSFPENTERILFSQQTSVSLCNAGLRCVSQWSDIKCLLIGS